jgi:hypothetical protein
LHRVEQFATGAVLAAEARRRFTKEFYYFYVSGTIGPL